MISLTPSPCGFGLVSIPRSIFSGRSRTKQSTCFAPCCICPIRWSVKWGFQPTSVPFTVALAELGCHPDPDPGSNKQVHAGVIPQGFDHRHISKCCHYAGSGVGSLESSPSPSHLHPLANLPSLPLSQFLLGAVGGSWLLVH